MSYAGLSDFLEELLKHGELVRVTATVRAELEIAEITARCAAAGGPALLFERIEGHSLPVVTNLLGTDARACRALGTPSLAALAERMGQLARPGGGQSWLDRLRGGEAAPVDKFRGRPVRQAAVQQAVRLGRDIDLAALPALSCWPGETGRALSGRLLLGGGEDRPTSVRLVRGVVSDRKQLLIPDDAGIERVLGVGGAGAVTECTVTQSAAGEFAVPAALVIGGDPAGTLAAAINWTDLDGFVLAGLLRNQAYDTVPARSQPLVVPADAEMVIEGVLRRAGDQRAAEGAVIVQSPAMAHPASGYYVDASVGAWLLDVSAVTHRASPVLPLAVVGDLAAGCPMGETAVLHRVRHCLLEPLVRAAIPELIEFALPSCGGRAGYAVLSIRKSYAGQSRRVAHALWGMLPLEQMKCVVVVDEDVDVRAATEVLGRIAANVSPERDIFFQTGPASPVDHAAPQPGLATHMGIDATAKVGGEHPRNWPGRLERPAAVREAVTRRWHELGLPPAT